MATKQSNPSKGRAKDLGFNWIELTICVLFILILHPPAIDTCKRWSEHFLQRDYISKYPKHLALNKLRNQDMRPGYLVPDRFYDLSDRQYMLFHRFFILQIRPMALFVCITSIIRFILRRIYKQYIKTDKTNQQSLTSSLSRYLVTFYVLINIPVTYYFHGTTATFVLAVMMMNYFICKSTYKWNHANLIAWSLNLLIMFLIVRIDRIYWSFEHLIHADLKWIDGLIRQRMRFTQTFRFILLRCISFNLDLISNYTNKHIHASKFEVDKTNSTHDYTLLNYFGYTLYVPLNFTGPIISFHDWISQIKSNISSTNPYALSELTYKSIVLYLVRFLSIYLITEWMLHYLYIPLMSKQKVFPIYLDECKTDYDYAIKIIQLSLYCYFCIFFLWTKFLMIWRYQRLIALCDGIVAPEDMLRCVHHHTSIVGFWRYWHASFNLWNKRYIYIPLGGSKVQSFALRIRNIICVFVFTTLWHGDFEFKLLLWGSLMTLLILPEIMIKQYYYNTTHEWVRRAREHQTMNRYIHATGGVVNIMMLFIANLIGFGPGYETVIQLLQIIVFKWVCVATFIGVCMVVFCGVLIMFHVEYLQAKGYGWNTLLRVRNKKQI